MRAFRHLLLRSVEVGAVQLSRGLAVINHPKRHVGGHEISRDVVWGGAQRGRRGDRQPIPRFCAYANK